MTAVSIPAFSLQYDLATALDYKSKHHFINTSAKNGGAMFQAVVLMYDDIQRVQTGPEKYFNSSELDTFIFHEFENNSIWFMDELVGIESDWNRTAAASATSGNKNLTAYGFVQFTEETVVTAVNRYHNHIDRFNARVGIRNWTPRDYGSTRKMDIPRWLKNLKVAVDEQVDQHGRPTGLPGPKYNHKSELNKLTYDQQIALGFVHLHRKESKDSNFRLLALGNIEAAKTIYKLNHHTNPKQATLDRLNTDLQPGLTKDGKTIAGTEPGFFRLHYAPANQFFDDIKTSFTVVIEATRSLPAEIVISAAHFLKSKTIDQVFTPEYIKNAEEVRVKHGVD